MAPTLLPDYPSLDLSAIDSDLDLVWSNDSGFFGLGGFRYSTGVAGSELISQGYRFVGTLSNTVTLPTGPSPPFVLAVAVRPTASVWEPDGTQQCGEGQVSWNAQAMLFQQVNFGIFSGWRNAEAYFTIPCHAYTCGQGPQSFSITKSVEFSITPFPFAFNNGEGGRAYFTASITLESA
jgi:hypothetical protein